MSMHQYMPDQAVLADSWTLFCPECSQKMRLIMATPALDESTVPFFESWRNPMGGRGRVLDMAEAS